MKYINSYAFAYCGFLTDVIIPETTINISYSAFYRCRELREIYIPKNVEFIESYAFAFCNNLRGIWVSNENTMYSSSEDGILYNKEKSQLIQCPGAYEGSFVCPLSVTEIGDYAFNGCWSLTNIYLTKNLESVGMFIFRECKNLEGIWVNENNVHYANDEDGAFYNKEMSTLIKVPSIHDGVFSVPSSVKSMRAYALDSCSNLVCLVLSKDTTSLGITSAEIESASSFKHILFAGEQTEWERVLQDKELYVALGNIEYHAEATGREVYWKTNGNKNDLYCEICNKVLKTVDLEECAHTETAKRGVQEATCITDGYSGDIYCLYCNTVVTKGFAIPAKGHAWDEGVVIKHPTESEVGERLFTCTRCAETKTEKIPVIEHIHAYSSEIVPSTCTEQGYTVHTCSCGDSYKDSYTAAKGHGYSNGSCVNCGVADPNAGPLHNPFEDVKEKDYFYTPVLWAVQKGITNGTSATKFSPEAPCTRGQIVTFLWRACGSPEPSMVVNPFTDVSKSAYYYKAVLWALENGITTGTGKDKFSPEATCTRGQVATFLWRAQGKPTPTSSNNPFNDVNSDAYYYNAILWAVEKGVTNGTGKGRFSPDASCTRGQIVTFLYRALS